MAVEGAQNLGHAQGTIGIDLSDLRSIQGQVKSIAEIIGRSMGSIDVGTRKAETGFARLNARIGGLRSELAGLSVGAGLLSGLGTSTAASFQESAIKLSGMVGGMEKADALMDDLRKKSAAAGLPFADMLATAERLLPTFKGNTKELERWYNLVRRTAVLNATEGMTGAAFSINEAITSGGTDMVSLVERFNISRAQLRAELAANGNDFYDALDKVLTRMGITNETALRMGQTFNASFRAAKDAAFQFLAEGFTPLLQIMTPLLQKTAAWLAELREANPLVAQIGAGLAATVTVGAPLLLLFNQLVEAGQKLQALGVIGGLARAGGVGLAVGAGVGLGIGVTNAIGRATGNDKMANTGMADLWKTIQQLFFNIAWTITKLFQGLVEGIARLTNQFGHQIDFIVSLASRFGQAVSGMIQAAGRFIAGLANLVPTNMGGDKLRQMAQDIQKPVSVNGEAGARALNASAEFRKQSDAFFLNWANSIMPPAAAPDAASTGSPGGAAGANVERDKVISQWAKDVAKIEQDAAKARLDEERSYGDQRDQTIRQYNQSALREEEDFQRSRSRAVAAYNRQVLEVMADATERDAEWQKDYNEKIADLRTDGNEKLADLERTYNRDRERRERDHRDRLLDAVGRLDAIAIADEQRRYNREQQDADSNYEEQQGKLQDDLAERLAQEKKAHEERLAAAHEADQERLADMKQAFEEQIAEQDIERSIQLQRRADDFAQQLADMAAAHAERLAQIDQQAAQERQALDAHFVEQLNDLGIYNKAWRDQQALAQAESLKLFQQFWKDFIASIPQPTQGPQAPYPGNLGQFPTTWSDFGFGGNRAAAAGGSSSSTSITLAEGAIVVNAAPSQDEREVARQVRIELGRFLEEVAK